jgi:hypothetical protein
MQVAFAESVLTGIPHSSHCCSSGIVSAFACAEKTAHFKKLIDIKKSSALQIGTRPLKEIGRRPLCPKLTFSSPPFSETLPPSLLRPEPVFLKCETQTLLRTVGMTGPATSLGNVTARCTRHCLPPFGGAVSEERLSSVSTQVWGVFHCLIVAAQIKASAKNERIGRRPAELVGAVPPAGKWR